MKGLCSLNLGLRTGIAAQLMMYKNNLDKTVIAARNVKLPKAAKVKAAIPKNKTELAGVRNLT